jgi:hypothetical protein
MLSGLPSRKHIKPVLGRMTGFGAEQKHVALPTDVRSPPENGLSRCGHLTARFAPQLPFVTPAEIGPNGGKARLASLAKRRSSVQDSADRPSFEGALSAGLSCIRWRGIKASGPTHSCAKINYHKKRRHNDVDTPAKLTCGRWQDETA